MFFEYLEYHKTHFLIKINHIYWKKMCRIFTQKLIVHFTNNYKEMVNNALNEMLHFDEAE